MDETLLNRSVNEGFSGGEKKRNEIFQMAVLEPKLAILDETDSGLDIDALRIVADGVNALRSPERAMLVVTHYQRLLELHRAGLRARAGRRPHRAVRRQGAGAGTRSRRATPGSRRTAAAAVETERTMAEIAQLERYLDAFTEFDGEPARAPPWLRELREPRSRALRRSGFPPRATKTGGSPTSPRSRERRSSWRRGSAESVDGV